MYWQYANENELKGFEIAKRGLEVAQRANFRRGIASFTYKIGVYQTLEGNFFEAAQNLNRAYLIYDSLQNNGGKARVLLKVAELYQFFKDYDYALKVLNQVDSLFQHTHSYHDHHDWGVVLSYKGFIYLKLGDFENAKRCQSRAFYIYKNLNDSMRIASSLVNMADIYVLPSSTIR